MTRQAVWTVRDVEVVERPPYVKRYPLGDGLVLAVYPSGRMVWQRSYQPPGAKLKWLTFGVHAPSDDPKFISEIKARSLNEEFREKKAEGTLITKLVDVNITLLEVFERYLETVDNPSTKAAYRSYIKPLKRFYETKWRLLNDEVIETELYERYKSGEVSLVAVKEAFYNIRRVSRFSRLAKRNKIPALTLFADRSFSALNFGTLPYTNHPGIVNENDFRELYRHFKARWLERHEMSVAALLVLAHFPKRVGEILGIKWEYVDLQNKEISLPERYEKVKKWKMDYPISDWMNSFLLELKEHKLSGDYAFMVRNGKPITAQALRYSLSKRYKGVHCPHGFRSSFRTIVGNILKAEDVLIETQMGHEKRDAYNRRYENSRWRMDDRRVLANAWSAWLEEPDHSTSFAE